MSTKLSGILPEDWQALCELWRGSDYVLSGEVGPRWEMPVEHSLCLDFAECYPDSKTFLIEKLMDPDPRIAAYAFKILIRFDVDFEEIPPDVFRRGEEIGIHIHSRIDLKTLGAFVSDFFGVLDADSLREMDRQTREWQDGPLAEYKRATSAPDSENSTD